LWVFVELGKHLSHCHENWYPFVKSQDIIVAHTDQKNSNSFIRDSCHATFINLAHLVVTPFSIATSIWIQPNLFTKGWEGAGSS
jgi:hypothetical protein